MFRYNKRSRRPVSAQRAILQAERQKGRAELLRRSWERCGDAFANHSSFLEKKSSRPVVPSTSGAPSVLAERSQTEAQEVHIAWSSSDSDVSDGEVVRPSASRAVKRQCPRLRAVHNSYSAYLRMITAVTQTGKEELQQIEWQSDWTDDEKGDERPAEISDCESPLKDDDDSLKLSSGVDVDISDRSSEGGSPTAVARTRDNLGPACVGGSDGERSASHWARSLQALLRTPKKQEDRSFRTPEDSAKKNRKFLRGGLAERLCRLQSRQRSAITFWRHQNLTDSGSLAEAKPGVLVLKLLAMWHEGSLRLARCQGDDKQPTGQLLVLFDRDTAAHLRAGPGDTIHVHPPWQKLTIEGWSLTVILNTHFSQKALHEGEAVGDQTWAAAACFPYPLTHTFGLVDESWLQTWTEAAGPSYLALPRDCETCDSLLELMESHGWAGLSDRQVEVVVQRVYCLPVPEPRFQSLRTCRGSEAVPTTPSTPTPSRLCLLVQDVYGVFSEVQLHTLSQADDLLHYTQKWEGRLCTLRGVKTVQRLTRSRSSWLFSLIDSLWPPTVAPRGHAASQGSLQNAGRLHPPSFCYLLTGSCGERAVQVMLEGSNHELYLPARPCSLRDILQGVSQGHRCTFTATVVYQRLKYTDEGPYESWLFVTDASLQDGEDDLRRTVPVYVSRSCGLLWGAAQAVIGPKASPCQLTFRDVVWEHDAVVCVERSLVQLQALQGPAPVLARLDPLGPNTATNTLCCVRGPPLQSMHPSLGFSGHKRSPHPSLGFSGHKRSPHPSLGFSGHKRSCSGVVVAVDENTAYSWPTCSLCGSDQLEAASGDWNGFLCTRCHAVVSKPTVKMQLEVLLSCPSLSQCTVRIKLIQETIMSILSWTGSSHEGYQVENLLGTELGPLSAYVRAVMGQPVLWVSLEEISL